MRAPSCSCRPVPRTVTPRQCPAPTSSIPYPPPRWRTRTETLPRPHRTRTATDHVRPHQLRNTPSQHVCVLLTRPSGWFFRASDGPRVWTVALDAGRLAMTIVYGGRPVLVRVKGISTVRSTHLRVAPASIADQAHV